MRALPILLVICFASPAFAQAPKILLTAQHLRRLQRDRERQTPRWTNFEKRVQTVADSPERGFELALYYAVTQDAQRRAEAIAWMNEHPCRDLRQTALIISWAEAPVPSALTSCPAGPPKGDMQSRRNALFVKIATGQETPGNAVVENPDIDNAPELYAYCESLEALASAGGRSSALLNDPQLPARLLLALPPEQVEHPDWQTHIAALALVDLQPNQESAQFLQSWAMEDRFTIQEGPGVAYEFFWANPYLPGIGYQNMPPWLYQKGSFLAARTDWSPHSCWFQLSKNGLQQENCPAAWQERTNRFGRLSLVPTHGKCSEFPVRQNSEDAILWQAKPGAKITYSDQAAHHSDAADALGVWRLPANIHGKVCVAQ